MSKLKVAVIALIATLGGPHAVFSQERASQESTGGAVSKDCEAAILGGYATPDCWGDLRYRDSGHRNADGSYTDSNGYIVDSVGKGSGTTRAFSGGGDYVRFETSDGRFNKIMNYVGNNPRGCISSQDADYISGRVQQDGYLCSMIFQHSTVASRSSSGCVLHFNICP